MSSRIRLLVVMDPIESINPAARGVVLRDLPLTPERIWRALREAELKSDDER